MLRVGYLLKSIGIIILKREASLPHVFCTYSLKCDALILVLSYQSHAVTLAEIAIILPKFEQVLFLISRLCLTLEPSNFIQDAQISVILLGVKLLSYLV